MISIVHVQWSNTLKRIQWFTQIILLIQFIHQYTLIIWTLLFWWWLENCLGKFTHVSKVKYSIQIGQLQNLASDI